LFIAEIAYIIFGFILLVYFMRQAGG